MKYTDYIQSVLNDVSYGFIGLVAAPKDFKDRVLKEVVRSNSSVATLMTFFGFLELQLAEQTAMEDIDLSQQMFMAAIFIGNGCGLDPTKHSDFVCSQDVADFRAVDRVQNEQRKQTHRA